MTQLALDLFPDVDLVPTIAMTEGRSDLHQCSHCGTLVCRPAGLAMQADRLGTCPACSSNTGWSRQPIGVGPFKPTGPVRAWTLWQAKTDLAHNGRARPVYRVLLVYEDLIITRCEHSACTDTDLDRRPGSWPGIDTWLDRYEQITEADLNAIRTRHGKAA